MANDVPDRMEHRRSSSRNRDQFTGTPGPSFQQDGRSVDEDGEGDLRFRLMEKKTSEENKERMNADPNYVPQGRYYYEVFQFLDFMVIDYYSTLISSTTIVKGFIAEDEASSIVEMAEVITIQTCTRAETMEEADFVAIIAAEMVVVTSASHSADHTEAVSFFNVVFLVSSFHVYQRSTLIQIFTYLLVLAETRIAFP